MAAREVRYDDPIVRKRWVRQGLLGLTDRSYWAPMIANNGSGVIEQFTFENASDGQIVTIESRGILTGTAKADKEKVVGTGEQGKLYSNNMTIRRYRKARENGDVWDAHRIGDLSYTSHGDAMQELGNWWMRWRDQYFFDVLQGNAKVIGGGADGGFERQAPTHQINVANLSDFTLDWLVDLENKLENTDDWDVGGTRAPLEPMRTADGQGRYILLLDTDAVAALRKNDDYKTILSQADVRGPGNRLINGVVGTLGKITIVSAPVAFGEIPDGTDWDPKEISCEMPGIRRQDANGKWTGQAGYQRADANRRFGYILGKDAIQIGYGKSPDYQYKPSDDYGITSESMLEWYLNAQKTKRRAVWEDNPVLKQAGIDVGVITIRFGA